MATFKPFCAIRPDSKYAASVGALPYDVMSSEEAREMAGDNKNSFLHVDKAEIDLEPGVNIYDDLVYETAKKNFEELISSDVLIKDQKPCYYIYRLIMDGRVQTGIVGCALAEEYLNNTIKKHELTRVDKENDRIRHIETLNANTGPIFFAYRENNEINDFVNKWVKDNSPVYDFTAETGVRHTVWVVEETEKLDKAFGNVSNFYIADGHHRNAAAVKVHCIRIENGNKDVETRHNYYLAVAFPDNCLSIMAYNRVVKDLNGHNTESFLNEIKKSFIIAECNKQIPAERHSFTMYLEGKWYKLTANESIIPNDPVESLDVSILQNSLLCPVLGIDDPRTNKRIDFVGGIRGINELEKLVNSGEMKIAFAMYPTTINELFVVSDNNLLMPPKSTWFEPKLLSGLFIHSLEN